MNAESILSALTDVRDGFINDADAPVRKGRPVIRRIAVLAAALVLCVALAATAAAYTDVGYAILYDFSPAIAQTLKPVNESCEANGVRMTVTDAGIDGSNAWFRIAMTDLEGDLFDGSIDLCDSYHINRFFDSVGSCYRESYDESTHTATFLAQLGAMDGSAIKPGKVTFRVREFSGHTEKWDGAVDSVDLSSLPEADQTVKREGFAMNMDTGLLEYPEIDCLVPGEPTPICPGAALTGAAWVDGKLHIQTRAKMFSASGIVYLTPAPEDDMEAPGAILDAVRANFYNGNGEDGYAYEEFIFDVTPEQAQNLTLKGWFYLMDAPTEGPWEVTFRLK